MHLPKLAVACDSFECYMPVVRGILPLLLLGCTACGEELVEPGRMLLTPGHEPDVWGTDVTHGTVTKEDDSGNSVQVSTFVPPISAFSLGTGKVAHFVLTGYDDSEAVKVRGRSLLVSPAGFAGGSLDLFIARAGLFARPPGQLVTDPGAEPASTILAGRFLLLGGPGGQLDGYDFGAWLPVDPPPPLECQKPPCDLRSLAVVAESVSLGIGDDFAVWFDPIDGGVAEATKPAGLASWADVAGGETIVGSDATAYVVGPTRATGPTSAVLHILEDGALELVSTSAPRAGAAATWVAGRGLCLVGGGDQSAAGAELLAEGATGFGPLPYAADPVSGAGAVALDGSRVLRIGGKDATGKYAPTVELSLGCGAGCAPKAAGDTLETAGTHAFLLKSSAVLAVGQDGSGHTVVARLESEKLTPIALREPRKSALSLAIPTGHVGVFAGLLADGSPAKTVELFIE